MILLTERPTPGTLNDVQGDRGWAALDGRDNALNAIRLVLATAVIVGHSWEIGFGVKPPIPDLASYGVDGFFAISGYLIASSRTRLAPAPFLWRRAVRIFPGLWACLLVTAFVIAPLAAPDGYSPRDAGSYVWSNWLLQMGQLGIGDTLSGAHVADQWNGSLWTLTYEFACYLALCLLFTRKNLRAPGVAAAVAAGALLALTWPPAMDVFPIQQSVRFAGFFAAGALLYLLRDRIQLDGRRAAGGVVLVAVAAALPYPTFWAVAPLPLAYLLLWAGAALPTRIGQRNDISYGMYVYAFPVQQALVAAGLAAAVGPAAFAICSVAATAPLAAASWLLVERPAMRVSRRPAPPSRRGPTTPARLRRAASPSAASRQAAGS